MIWLAGFALAFFIVALCFVSMGYLRSDLKQANADKSESPSFSIADNSSSIKASITRTPVKTPLASPARPLSGDSNSDGIVVISRSVSDILSAFNEPQKKPEPQSVSKQNTAENPLFAAGALAAASAAEAFSSIVVPRLKPVRVQRFAENTDTGADYARDVPMPIDVNGTWLADNIRLGFALDRDFTGGVEPLFTKSDREAPLPDVPSRGNIIRLKSGETLSEALTRLNIREADRASAIAALSREIDVRSLRPGTEITASTTAPELTVFQEAALLGHPELMPGHALKSLELTLDSLRRVEVVHDAASQFSARVKVAETTKRYAAVSGTITDSLFASAARRGMPHAVAASLSNMFLYDIDFQREIRQGDEFEAVYEVFYDELGRITGYGDILYGTMSWLGGAKARGYYRFDGDDEASWFDETGSSARRLLMKTPIEGARITSSFGLRQHPVLGYTKGHKGTDFGANRGTPIMAAGDGVIERANVFSTYGNYVKIQHAAGYETAYAHLNGFAPGIKAGARVRQGDIIGYVGTTGRSTGPHLHYEVLKDGVQVNPMTIKVATGRNLDGEDLEQFQAERGWIDAMRGKVGATALASL